MASRHYGEFEILDYSEEISSISFSFGAITALSLPGFLTDFGNLRTALGGIIKGTIRREKWTGDETVVDNIPPVDSDAQVEICWRVSYEELPITIRSRAYTVNIATADPNLTDGRREEMDYSLPAAAAFIAAFEALVKTPEGNSIVVANIDFVGRRR